LTRKAAQLEAARQVAANIASQTDINSLLTTTVDVIREKFDFYHAGVFLPDDNHEFAVLRAATGEPGRTLLKQGHRLKIGEVGIVGYVMSKGEPRIAGNVAEDPAHYVNPVLPDTHSEMAVPMKLGDQIVGVLDVQSTRRNAFSSDDVDVLLTIADQLSSALEKARLLDQYQKNVEELKHSAQQTTRLAWRQHLRDSRRRYAYRYRQMQVEAIPNGQEEIDQILWEDAPLSTQSDGRTSTIQVPIKLRDQTIGVVNLKLSTNRVTNEMVELVENAIDRMAVSLETVRLLEDIQARSERDRLVGEIATKVRAATDIDTILRTTANELGRSLGVSDVLVQLTPRE
jgi:GAF domain-containing protein